MDACWEADEHYCCNFSKSLEFCKLESWGKYLKNSKQDVPFHLKAGQCLPFPSLRHKGHLPAELMMCLTTWRVPTRVLSLLVSSLGSRKASRRSGEQQAAGQALIKELFVTSCPMLPAGCLHLQDKLGPAAREAGRSGLRPSQVLAVCSPETRAGSTRDKGPPAPQSSQAAGLVPSTVKQRSTSFWLLITRGLEDSTGTQICSGTEGTVTGPSKAMGGQVPQALSHLGAGAPRLWLEAPWGPQPTPYSWPSQGRRVLAPSTPHPSHHQPGKQTPKTHSLTRKETLSRFPGHDILGWKPQTSRMQKALETKIPRVHSFKIVKEKGAALVKVKTEAVGTCVPGLHCTSAGDTHRGLSSGWHPSPHSTPQGHNKGYPQGLQAQGSKVRSDQR